MALICSIAAIWLCPFQELPLTWGPRKSFLPPILGTTLRTFQPSCKIDFLGDIRYDKKNWNLKFVWNIPFLGELDKAQPFLTKTSTKLNFQLSSQRLWGTQKLSRIYRMQWGLGKRTARDRPKTWQKRTALEIHFLAPSSLWYLIQK